MHRGFKVVKDAVRQHPLLLAKLTDRKLVKFANSMLPYSTGIEIECACGSVDEYMLEKIDGVMKADTSSDEIRVRLEPGIKGMMALYHVCNYIKENTGYNLGSGIHYHIDCTDVTGYYYFAQYCIQDKREMILDAIAHWRYKGRYNSWTVSEGKKAVKLHHDYQTIEFRIGEMTFEYELMMKRILNCQNIVKKLKKQYEEYRKTEF